MVKLGLLDLKVKLVQLVLLELPVPLVLLVKQVQLELRVNQALQDQLEPSERPE